MVEPFDSGPKSQVQIPPVFVFVCFVFVCLSEGFTTVVANEGLEKATAYLNQVPWDRWLYIPSEGCGVNF